MLARKSVQGSADPAAARTADGSRSIRALKNREVAAGLPIYSNQIGLIQTVWPSACRARM